MIANSITRINAKNQQSSWTDDPFDLKGMKGFVTGVKPLSNQRRLEDYAQELVSNYGEFINNQYELNLEKISSPYQLELVKLYIETIDREIDWACYGKDQSINSSFLCAMLDMLENPNPTTQANFAHVTACNLIDYYKESLQHVLDTACHDLHCNEMNNNNYYQDQDLQNGEYIWRVL